MCFLWLCVLGWFDYVHLFLILKLFTLHWFDGNMEVVHIISPSIKKYNTYSTWIESEKHMSCSWGYYYFHLFYNVFRSRCTVSVQRATCYWGLHMCYSTLHWLCLILNKSFFFLSFLLFGMSCLTENREKERKRERERERFSSGWRFLEV